MQAPKNYEFGDRDRESYSGKFFAMNPEIVSSGQLAESWRESGIRGGGLASSMLPVLAIETWPNKKADTDRIHGLDVPSSLWTAWASQSHRRTARVAGIGVNSVAVGYRCLEKRGLCQVATVPCKVSLGGKRTYYRLSTSLYAPEGKASQTVSGHFLYGGHWRMLPTNAARHLYLVLAALDPIRNPAAFERYADDKGLDYEEALESLRASNPSSWGELERLSSLSRRQLAEAIGVLIAPIPSGGKVPYPPYFQLAVYPNSRDRLVSSFELLPAVIASLFGIPAEI